MTELTAAGRLVVTRFALLQRLAGILLQQARIDALVLDAGLARDAISVRRADDPSVAVGQTQTLLMRIAAVTRRTRALRRVQDSSTEGVYTACPR